MHCSQRISFLLILVGATAAGVSPPGRIQSALAAESGGSATTAARDTWDRFRGPNGTGVAAAGKLPISWSETDYRWRVDLPGIGHSSPVVRGGRVFVTCGDEKTGQRTLQCRSAADGQLVWQRTFDGHTHPKNKLNCYASSSPTLDDARVFLSLVMPDEYLVVALDQATGEERWRRTLGGYSAEHGFGSSPIVFEGLLLVTIEQNPPEDPHAPAKPSKSKKPAPKPAAKEPQKPAAKGPEPKSSIVALDCRSGEIRWQSPRHSDRAAYSTPCIYQPQGQPPQLILTSSGQGYSSIDPRTGKANWELPLYKNRVVGSPIIAAGLIIASSGSGGGGKQLYAVRPGDSQGKVKPEQVYEIKPPIPYVPTPVCDGPRVYLLGDGGVATCVEAATGKQVWQERIGGNYFASPILVGDRIYCVSRDGEMVVLAAGEHYKQLARFSLGEASNATPAVVDGVMYLRTISHLMAVGPR